MPAQRAFRGVRVPHKPIQKETPMSSISSKIDELNADIEAAQAAGNDDEAEELYMELERLTAEMS